ncbi:ABC transporter substrate-binding protein [Ochrobactrum sp. BTU1]|uniref:ABC transporter substrate-binding protein n=1 Tax=Ochrobactrum sp. BTU1 TaxID=2840456 RepID=UPI001C03F176|nr:ABC transporter substrate-binding protein [Ochrobactrum sp. BTU1]
MLYSRRQFLVAGAATTAVLYGGLPIPAHSEASGVLNIAVFPEPTSLVAGVGTTGPSMMVIGNIYDGLLRYDENLQPLPNLATEWSISDDHLSYTFKLKEGVKWHDGQPFTAEDVVFSVDKYMRTLGPRVRVVMASVESIKAVDDLTVEFKLKQPFPAFIGIFDVSTLPIVPKHQLGGVDLSKPVQVQPIGTGAFKFVAWERGAYIQLAANDDFHEPGMPKIKNIYWHIIPDASSRAVAFESGKVDVLPGGTIEFFDVTRLQEMDGVTVTTKGWEKLCPISFMWINHRNPVLANLKVRQALMHAINRDALAQIVWQGFAQPATGPFSRGTAGYTDQTTNYIFDTDKAKALLDEAGYKGETIRLLPLQFGEVWVRMAEAVRQNLQQAGFKVEMVSADVPTTLSLQSNWDFDLAFTLIYTNGDPALGVSRNYVSSEIKKGSPFNNVGGYSNARVDELFSLARVEADPEKQKQLYAEVQKILVDDVAEAWLLDLTYPTVYRSKINSPINTGLGINDSLARASIS